MKYKISIFIVLTWMSFSGCLKDSPAVDFSTVGTIVEILPVNGGGIENFDAAALTFDPADAVDQADIVLNIASPNTLSKTLTVTMEVNDGLRQSYNTTYGTSYDALPDSVYSFTEQSGTIAAGKRLDTLHVNFYPSKIDNTKNYMLPVSIKDAQGQTISGNFGAIYFHIDAQ
ncbi:MAG: DUF1735 domain-containing protein [Bacteroidetes bacterium]|nr:DUF1735 domain-containing protein [Bacteroidota bacterium]